jgi:calcium-dependent protein kinase
MFQILQAMTYCHDRHIVHRDLKPENILLESKKLDSPVVIVDFGTSRVFNAEEKMEYKFGTPFYVAPEVIDGFYDEKCDVWSLGVMLYIMLSGNVPFFGENNLEIFREIRYAPIEFSGGNWNLISKQAKDLV